MAETLIDWTFSNPDAKAPELESIFLDLLRRHSNEVGRGLGAMAVPALYSDPHPAAWSETFRYLVDAQNQSADPAENYRFWNTVRMHAAHRSELTDADRYHLREATKRQGKPGAPNRYLARAFAGGERKVSNLGWFWNCVADLVRIPKK